MVVLAASICTRGGKVVLSRQFIEVPRSRIEGLLAAFPKLTDSNTQHTTVETDNVRYVYQPLDELYMVLVTNKQSNILQDIDSLHLFAQLVSSICKTLDEREILKNAFDLLSAFDEVVALGYRENLSLAQIRTFLEMESHEERIQEIIARNKEFEASEERKRKAKQLDLQRKEAQRAQRSMGGGGMGGMGGGMGGGTPRTPSFPSYAAPTAQKSAQSMGGYDSYEAEKKKTFTAPKGKGMQLGKKKAGGAFDKLRQELGPEVEESAPLISSTPTHHAVASPPRQSFSADHNPITILISEVIEAAITKDGSVKSYEIKGDLALRITDSSLSKIRLDVAIEDSHGAVFKTHPNVDKAQFNSSKAIQPKALNKPFPANGQALEVLRWRHAAKGDVDAANLPISFTVWFNRGSGSEYTLTVEYELQNPDDELRDLTVSIPFVTAEPTITSVDEVYEVNGDTIDWSISRIDRDNASGAFEMEGVADDEAELFPMSIRFAKETPVINVDVTRVTLVEEGEDVDFTKTSKSTGEFTIE